MRISIPTLIIVSLILFGGIGTVQAQTQWEQDQYTVYGLPNVGSIPSPAVYQNDGALNMIIGNSSGYFTGVTWTNNRWNLNSSVVEGLGYTIGFSHPTVFNRNGTPVLITGHTGEFNEGLYGYTWSNGKWNRNDSEVVGLQNPGWKNGLTPTVFTLNNKRFLIMGTFVGSDPISGVLYGYRYYNGVWQSDSSILSGLTGLENFFNPTTFTKNGITYLMLVKDSGDIVILSWNGSAWIQDMNVSAGLPNFGAFHIWESNYQPAVFENNGKLSFVMGNTAWFGYTFSEPQPPALNIIKNGDFNSGKTDWTFYTNAMGSFNVVSGVSNIQLNSIGSNMQIYQTGVQLEANTKYRLSFDAYSSNGHDLNIKLAKHTSPYTNYGLNANYNLGTSWQTFTTEFTPSMTVNDGRLMFWFVGFASAGEVYHIDNVRLEKVIGSVTPTPTQTPTPTPTPSPLETSLRALISQYGLPAVVNTLNEIMT